MESVRYSLVLILMIVYGIHSHQDAMCNGMSCFKDKLEQDMNEIKDAIRNISRSIQEIKNNSEKQRDDCSKIKDTVRDVSDLKERVNFICKERGSMCAPKFYVVPADTASFNDAAPKCRNRNMTFAQIRNEEEFDALNGYLQTITVSGNAFRVSGVRVNTGSLYYWNPSGQLMTNEKWWPGYPNNSEQHNCVFVQLFINNNIRFHTDNCNAVRKYVCEYKK